VLEPDVEPELEEALDFDDPDEPEEALDVTEVAELIDPVVELRLEPELEVADVELDAADVELDVADEATALDVALAEPPEPVDDEVRPELVELASVVPELEAPAVDDAAEEELALVDEAPAVFKDPDEAVEPDVEVDVVEAALVLALDPESELALALEVPFDVDREDPVDAELLALAELDRVDVEPAADAELELAEAVDTEAPEDRAPETEALPDEAPLEDAVEVAEDPVEAAEEAVAELELLAADPVADPDAADELDREVVDARVLAIAVAVDAVEAPTVRAVEPDARAEEAALADRDEDVDFPPHPSKNATAMANVRFIDSPGSSP
jgi:hypothetical protein